MPRPNLRRPRLSAAKLREMIDEATVDAYDASEQASGWHAVIEDNLELPFDTTVLGVTVRVTRVDLRGDGGLVAVCVRGRERQAIGLVDLPLAARLPPGSEWIEAYRTWLALQ